jgi:hypothetical protein
MSNARIGTRERGVRRLEPELHDALANGAARDHETTSSVIRKSLRQYLKVK